MRAAQLLVLAIVAVLVGAPSMTSAAGPNTLSAPQASPTSGTSDTLVSFGVTYAGGFPAISVSVSVAGRSLPMVLVSGTPSDGQWSTSTIGLPSGSWTTTFSAVASQGTDPSRAGPTITIASVAASPTSPTAVDPGDSPAAPSPDAAASEPATTPAPVAAPASPDPSVVDDGTDAPKVSPAAGTPTGSPAADESGPVAAPAGHQPAEPAPPSADGGGHADVTPPAAAPIERTASSSEAAPAELEAGEPPSVVGPAIAAGGAATLALLAWLLLVRVVARRRRPAAEDTGTTEPGLPAPAPPDPQVAAALHRRTLRRAKVRLEDDPIVATIERQRPTDPRRPRR